MKEKETYKSLKQEILDINNSLSSLLSKVQSRRDIAEERFEKWQASCTNIHDTLSEEVVRIAVIGAVKSGKSTFVNSLFKGDYLKRGAGVVTSIVTRIRGGEKLKAVLFFKSWDDINSEIEQALVMLPSFETQNDRKTFDIRRAGDRLALKSAIESLSDELLASEGIRDTNLVLLSLYLKGYDKVKDIVSADSSTTEFKSKKFPEHRTFVADDTLAVYLRDIELEIDRSDIDRSIEIADCQGSDSPNPLHLAMIQDYLLRTHFIIYVISSRTGLRQADIRFLSMIKNMGILDNILFIVNMDFSEHETLDDFRILLTKVREELALLKPDAEIFAFSALFNLFKEISSRLTKKDKSRLSYWESEGDMVEFSEKETSRFGSILNEKLTRERFGLLLRNQIERMDVLVSGLERWIRVNRELMEKDIEGATSIIKKMENVQKRMEQIQYLLKNTFRGATDDILKELKSEIDRFFNAHPGGVLERTMSYINQYSLSVEKYRDKLTTSSFSSILYLLFQEFKQSLDSFMAENINPEIARFTVKIENRIKTSMEAVAGPYQAMASDDISDLKAIIDDYEREEKDGPEKPAALDMDALKRVAGLKLPSSTAALQYYTKVRAEALVRLGFYSVKKLFRKAIKKPLEDEKESQLRALSDGVKFIKRETEKSIVFHFENYRENFKFQYMARLLNASAEYLHQRLIERFQSYTSDIEAMEKVVEKKGGDREELIELLDQLNDEIQNIKESIERTRKETEKTG